MIRPDGAAYAFALSIDVDGDLPLLADDPSAVDREKTRSAGRYGPDHGVARLSALLADLDLKADWFFPDSSRPSIPTSCARSTAPDTASECTDIGTSTSTG